MLGKLIDNMIAPFAPKWAAMRLAWRLRRDVAMAYAAGERNRSTGGNPKADKSTSADSAILARRELVNARARAACRDTAHGAAIRRAFERRVVGGWGLTPTPTVMNADGSKNKAFNKETFRQYQRWARDRRVCDVEKRHSQASRQRMIIGEIAEVGEHFVVSSYTPPPQGIDPTKAPLGLREQSFEPEQLDMFVQRNPDNGNEIRDGVEVDDWGAAVAFHFLRQHPFDHSGIAITPKTNRTGTIRILAEDCDHIFDPRRVRQTHGITRMHASLKRLANIGYFEEATMLKARMEACIGILEEDASGGSNPLAALQGEEGGDGLDSDGNPEVNFQPAMYYKGKGKLSTFPGGTPSGTYDPFITQNTRAVGAGAGLAYGPVSMDFTKGTYSGQRQELLETYGEFDICIEVMTSMHLVRKWERFIFWSIAQGKLPAQIVSPAAYAADPDAWHDCDWMGTRRDWIDPEKEMRAYEIGIKLGVMTRERVLAELGYNVEDTFEQLKVENDLAKQLGIDVSGSKPATPPPGNPDDGAKKKDDEEQDETQQRIREAWEAGCAYSNRLNRLNSPAPWGGKVIA